MNNLIHFDEYVIGYKEDLIKYLEEENKKLRLDLTTDDYVLADYLNENIDILNKLNNRTNYELLAVGTGVMGDLVLRNVGIELE